MDGHEHIKKLQPDIQIRHAALSFELLLKFKRGSVYVTRHACNRIDFEKLDIFHIHYIIGKRTDEAIMLIWVQL